jgi:hypothetical protein
VLKCPTGNKPSYYPVLSHPLLLTNSLLINPIVILGLACRSNFCVFLMSMSCDRSIVIRVWISRFGSRQSFPGNMETARTEYSRAPAEPVVLASFLRSLSCCAGGLTTYVLMALALLAMALVSGYLPARRALRINPIACINMAQSAWRSRVRIPVRL